jgi:hypothetical protein
MPLRLRLALIYGLLASLALALAVLLAYGYYARAAYCNLDGSLAILLEPVRLTLAEQGHFPEGIEAYRTYSFAIRYYDPAGRLVESAGNDPRAPQVEPGKVLAGDNPLPYGPLVARLPHLRASVPPPPGSAYGLLSRAGERWRVYVTPVTQGGQTLGYLQAVGPLAGFDQAVADLRLRLLLAWAGGFLVFGLGYLPSSPTPSAEPWPERGAQGPRDSGLARLSETLDTAFAQYRGQGWLEAVHPEHRERVDRAWEKAIREGQRYEIEYRSASPVYSWKRLRQAPPPGAGRQSSSTTWPTSPGAIRSCSSRCARPEPKPAPTCPSNGGRRSSGC